MPGSPVKTLQSSQSSTKSEDVTLDIDIEATSGALNEVDATGTDACKGSWYSSLHKYTALINRRRSSTPSIPSKACRLCAEIVSNE